MPMAEMPSIPGFECVRFLGINLGTVFLARESATGTLVALKVYRPEFASHFREIDGALKDLNHPNIVRILASGESERYNFLALEFIEGTLADRLLRGPLTQAEVVRLSLAIASALEYARSHGVESHNLTPSGILLSEAGIPKLMDFHPVGGDAGMAVPSGFMAPEELEGHVTAATDVYRIGAVMYAMLTGASPFGSETTALETLRRSWEQTPVSPRQLNPQVSGPLQTICLKCLEMRADARYATPRELVEALRPLGANPS